MQEEKDVVLLKDRCKAPKSLYYLVKGYKKLWLKCEISA